MSAEFAVGYEGMMNCNPPAERLKPSGFWTLIAIEKDYTAWQLGDMCALSSVVYVSDEHQPAHWEWLISFSKMGRMVLNDAEIKKCLKAFGAEDFMEDNHERGVARKFWKAVEEKYRVPCPCQNERVVVEGDYRYSVEKRANP